MRSRQVKARAEYMRAVFLGTAFLRAQGEAPVRRVSPGLWAYAKVLPRPSAPPSPRTQESTYGAQGLEFLPQVSHSALLAWVHWVPGTLFLQPVLCRLLQILAPPRHGCW